MPEQTNKDRHGALQAIEASKNRSNSHFDSHVHPHIFSEGDMVLVYDKANDKLRKGKFE